MLQARQDILARQTLNDAIRPDCPGTRMAHKTGEITRIKHDAAIVFARRPFVSARVAA